MLLALTSAGRASDLHLLHLSHMVDLGEEIRFYLAGLPKTRRMSNPKVTTLVFKGFEENQKLCVIMCLRTYINRSRSWRISADQQALLLSYVNPHNQVATSTISGWLMKGLELAGINTEEFKGHSTRSASTSKAAALGFSASEILSWANWRNVSTFNKFYNRKETFSNDAQEIAQAILKKGE